MLSLLGLYGLPRKMGQLKDISKFDSKFFGVHHKQAHLLDPQARILLESTYESIVDAGMYINIFKLIIFVLFIILFMLLVLF